MRFKLDALGDENPRKKYVIGADELGTDEGDLLIPLFALTKKKKRGLAKLISGARKIGVGKLLAKVAPFALGGAAGFMLAKATAPKQKRPKPEAVMQEGGHVETVVQSPSDEPQPITQAEVDMRQRQGGGAGIYGWPIIGPILRALSGG